MDKEIYDYVKNTDLSDNINVLNKKIILKNVRKNLTKELISNKKTGFAFPLQKHLYNDLKFELINEFQKLKNDERLGRLKTDKLNNIINRFLNNNDYKLVYQVWSIYVFSKWFNKYKKYINN